LGDGHERPKGLLEEMRNVVDDVELVEARDKLAAAGRDVAAGFVAAGPGGSLGPRERDDADAGVVEEVEIADRLESRATFHEQDDFQRRGGEGRGLAVFGGEDVDSAVALPL